MPIYVYAAVQNDGIASVPRYINQRQYLTLFNSKWGPTDLIDSAVYGFNYRNLTDLVRQIKSFFESGDKSLQQVLANNKDWLHTNKALIDKIAFECHGNAGRVAINSIKNEPLEYANAHPFGYPDLNELAELMSPDATIMFLSCLTGRSQPGTRFLIELSNNLKNKQIIAFAVYTAGALSASRPWESLHGLMTTVDPLSAERIKKKLQTALPTNYPLHTDSFVLDKQLKQFYLMRLDAESPYAKIAYNGYITKTPLYDAEYAGMEPEWDSLRKNFMIAFLGEGTPAEKVSAETYLKGHPNAWKRYEELSQKLDRRTTLTYTPFIGSPLEN